MNTPLKKVFLIYKEAKDEWLLPKGRMELGEMIETTAQREIFEETGYENKIEELISVQIREDIIDPTKVKIIFWFKSELAGESQAENTQTDDEHFTGNWFTKDEALNKLKWENDKKLIEKCFSKVK